jgi:Subtilase family
MQGTSMAAPHVAGLVAYLIAKDGNTSPAEMSEKIKALAAKGVLGYLRTSLLLLSQAKRWSLRPFDSCLYQQFPCSNWPRCLRKMKVLASGGLALQQNHIYV